MEWLWRDHDRYSRPVLTVRGKSGLDSQEGVPFPATTMMRRMGAAVETLIWLANGLVVALALVIDKVRFNVFLVEAGERACLITHGLRGQSESFDEGRHLEPGVRLLLS